MDKAQKKFRLLAIAGLFILLTVLLAVINGLNFTMAAHDADELTGNIAGRQGAFAPGSGTEQPGEPGFRMGRMGPMGPDSPEMNASLRYFTVSFPDGGEAVMEEFRISAVTQEEALDWASGLKKESTGWTRGTYRYRVYRMNDKTYVTVIDQGRELLPSFRILVISLVGEALVLVSVWLLLRVIGRMIYAPLEETDRKQKQFILSVNRQFRQPLTILYANTELTERENGPDDRSRSNRRQIEKMNGLIEKLGTVGIFDESRMDREEVPLSEYLCAAADREAQELQSAGIAFETEIEPGLKLEADPGGMSRMIEEVLQNIKLYAKSRAAVRLCREKGYILLEARNDADLPDGEVKQVFDRFAKLENGKEDHAGIGLSYVKGIVLAHNGRAGAEVSGGEFILRIRL